MQGISVLHTLETNVENSKFIERYTKTAALYIAPTKCQDKPRNFKYPKCIINSDFDKILTHQRIVSTSLNLETEGIFQAAQDKSLPRRSYPRHHPKEWLKPILLGLYSTK